MKVEIKNMNSFRSLEKAIRSEIERQTALVSSGERVVMETRHWDEEAEVTHGMRTKEGSSDYRYFTEPDLAPMVFDASWLEEARSLLPELPAVRRDRYRRLGVGSAATRVLASSDPELRSLFEESVESGADPVAAANWVTGEVTASLRRRDTSLENLQPPGRAHRRPHRDDQRRPGVRQRRPGSAGGSDGRGGEPGRGGVKEESRATLGSRRPGGGGRRGDGRPSRGGGALRSGERKVRGFPGRPGDESHLRSRRPACGQ